jgi:hypothetical protein
MRILVLGSLLASACARTPDVQASYYLPKSSLSVKAIRTVACDTHGTVFSATAVTSTLNFGRDEAFGLQPISFRALDGQLANNDLALSFYDDGRLKGINATTVGRGEEVFKSAISLASTVAGGGFTLLSTRPGVPPPTPCGLIKTFGGKEKMVTLVYSGSEKFDQAGPRASVLQLDAGSPEYHHQINEALSVLCFGVGAAKKDPMPIQVAPGETARAAINVKLRQPAKVPVFVSEGADEACATADRAKKIWSGGAIVPQLGDPYSLPIPTAALFGKQSMELALTESGIVTTLKYGKESGAAGILNVMNTGLTEAKPDSAATQAAEIKGEADLIAQQQRLIRCQLDASKCT